MPGSKYILTLSCPDKSGIVAAVSGFLNNHGGFITESSQFGDFSTEQFFMRCEFSSAMDASLLSQNFEEVGGQYQMQWQLVQANTPMKVVVMVTKEGHCFNHLLHKTITGALPIEIKAVISNHADLRYMADWHHIPFHHLPVSAATKKDQEKQVIDVIEKSDADLVVLARYMQILSPEMCQALSGRAINIHHSFLPGFKGAKPYHQAYDRGVKIIGATAHYVTTDLDEGPIIEQEVLRVDHAMQPEDLQIAGQDIEARVLSAAVKFHSEKRVFLNDKKTVVFR